MLFCAHTLQKLEKPEKEFSLSVPVSGPGEAKLKVSLTYYYCETGNEGLCKIANAIWTVPVTIDEAADETVVPRVESVRGIAEEIAVILFATLFAT